MDIICPHCASTPIQINDVGNDSIITSCCFKCTECGSEFDMIWGVPFFGNYDINDLLGLIEIVANIGNQFNGVDPRTVELYESLCQNYSIADNKQDFIRNNPPAQVPYFMNRFNEWESLMFLTKNISLTNCKALDVGAGFGYDSYRLFMRGANVTALEFSPILASTGRKNFPNIRWIGGFSHSLPFANESFDAIFCNAALHHMRDISASISESLRVLRPGGVLITTCDSFRSDESTPESELLIFDKNPDVLLGVNECVPRFSAFIQTLKQYRKYLDIEIYTHILYAAPGSDNNTQNITHLASWDFDKDMPLLSTRSGSLAMKIKLKEKLSIKPRPQPVGVVRPSELAKKLSSKPEAIAYLSSIMPSEIIESPFPGKIGTKFEMCNGWRLRKPFTNYRTGYRSARWFLKRITQTSLSFYIRSKRDAKFIILVNAILAKSIDAKADTWTFVEIDISHLEKYFLFALEIILEEPSVTFEDNCFDVRSRKLLSPKLPYRWIQHFLGKHLFF